MSLVDPKDFSKAMINALTQAKKVAVMTGAGISAESGIPTFREAQTGLWSQFRPEDLATPQAFKKDPKLVWEWYQWRRSLIDQARPNPGHFALAQMSQKFHSFTLITQNIDGFHTMAGSGEVIELHGNIHRTKCFDRHHLAASWTGEQVPPLCSRCGSLLRPDVVWFGEGLPEIALTKATQAARECDFFFSIGTSSVVYPAADIAFEAIRHGATTLEINPAKTPASDHFSYTLRAPAGEALPLICAALWGDS